MNAVANALRRRLERQRRRPRPDRRCRTSATCGSSACRKTSSRSMYKFYRKDERGDRHRRSLDAAGRRHPEYAACVQHQQHDGERLLDEPRRARGPLHRAGELGGLHPGRAGDCAPRNLLLLSPWFKRVRHRRDEAVRPRRHGTRTSKCGSTCSTCSTARTSRRSPNPGTGAHASSARPAPTRIRATPTIRAAASVS